MAANRSTMLGRTTLALEKTGTETARSWYRYLCLMSWGLLPALAVECPLQVPVSSATAMRVAFQIQRGYFSPLQISVDWIGHKSTTGIHGFIPIAEKHLIQIVSFSSFYNLRLRTVSKKLSKTTMFYHYLKIVLGFRQLLAITNKTDREECPNSSLWLGENHGFSQLQALLLDRGGRAASKHF